MQTIYLAGGCFWGPQRFLNGLPGVIETEVGYANGPDKAPSYAEVCANSGHAETVRVTFDEEVLPLDRLLESFFGYLDSTSVNWRADGIGLQYRRGIFCANEVQLSIARSVYDREQAKRQSSLNVTVEPLRNFFPAEEYHQNYLDKKPQRSCSLPRVSLAELWHAMSVRPRGQEFESAR